MICSPVRTLVGCAALALAMHASPARAGDFLDMRLSFNITDENVLVKPGETIPSIPGLRVGAPIPRWGEFFYDSYETRQTGFENRSSLVLYKKVADGQSDYEGAFVLRMSSLGDSLSAIKDGGSYVKWTHWVDPSRAQKLNLSLTAFPTSSDLFRLGFSRKTSWGGSPMFFKANPENPFASAGSSNEASAPGARVQLAGDAGYVFIGGKTSMLLNRKINEQETIYAALAGAGLDATGMLRVEANGGYFDRGVNPIPEVLGRPVQTYGGSAQVMLHDGWAADRSVDWKLSKNDPSSAAALFQAEQYPGGLSWLATAEGSYLETTLQDPTKAASTMRQPAVAGAVRARAKINRWRTRLDVSYRDLAYILVNVPSFVPFQALESEAVSTKPELTAAAGVDYNIEAWKLTIGVTGGAEIPALFTGHLPGSFTHSLPLESIPASSTVVVRSEGVFDILPAGYKVAPIYAGKLTAELQLADFFSILTEVLGSYDYNVTHLQRINGDSQLVFTRVFSDPWQLGFNVALQARL